MAIAFFVMALLFLGAWYLMRIYVPYEQITKPYLALALHGVSGALLAVSICIVASIIFCYNPWMSIPETVGNFGVVSWNDSRQYMFGAVALGVSMIGIPVGFLLGVARANKPQEEVSTAAKIPFPQLPTERGK